MKERKKKKERKKEKEMGALFYLPPFLDSYFRIVTFMIQYCDLHIMFKLNQILDLCIRLLKQISWGTGGGGHRTREGTALLHVSALWCCVQCCVFYFCPFICFTLI